MALQSREFRIRRVIVIEAIANAAIAVVKGWVGFATGSMAILGDMVHSLTDLANSLVAWMVVGWSSRPADADHPYGHRKYETVAVFLLAMLLVVTAFELALRALARSEPLVLQSGPAAVGMLGVLVANGSLATWEALQAHRLDSDILRADARHTLTDVLTTVVAIAGWQAAAAGHAWVDTATALAVSALILLLAFGLFRRSLPILVDQVSIDPEELRSVVLAVPGALDVRRPRSRSTGRRAIVDLVVVVEPDLSTLGSHEIATSVEHAIRARFPVEAVSVHVEPLGPGRERTRDGHTRADTEEST